MTLLLKRIKLSIIIYILKFENTFLLLKFVHFIDLLYNCKDQKHFHSISTKDKHEHG